MTLLKFTNDRAVGSFKSPYSDVLSSRFNPGPYVSKSLVSRTPALNISETDNSFLLEIATPGLKKADFKINVEKEQLTVSTAPVADAPGSDNSKKYTRREFNYTSFTRTFTLPDSADQATINAEYTDGILSVTIAKKEEAKVQLREISIK